MSNPRFTPGPWTVFYKHKYDEWHVSVPQDGGGLKLGLFADGCPTGEYDAHLISAAPDLYAACNDLLDALQEDCRDGDRWETLIDQAAAAMFKANPGKVRA